VSKRVGALLAAPHALVKAGAASAARQRPHPTLTLRAQARTDPEFHALLARQAGADAGGAGDAEPGGLTAQQKAAGLASVFKRDDSNLSRRRAPPPPPAAAPGPQGPARRRPRLSNPGSAVDCAATATCWQRQRQGARSHGLPPAAQQH